MWGIMKSVMIRSNAGLLGRLPGVGMAITSKPIDFTTLAMASVMEPSSSTIRKRSIGVAIPDLSQSIREQQIDVARNGCK